MRSVQPFRLLDLPQELQDDVYEKYFEGVRLTRLSVNETIPCLNIELACRKTCLDVRQVRDRVWPRIVHLDPFRWLRWIHPGALCLQERITTICLKVTPSTPTAHIAVSWTRLVCKCSRLRYVYIDAEIVFRDSASTPINHFLTRGNELYARAPGYGLMLDMLASQLQRKFGKTYSVQLRSTAIVLPLPAVLGYPFYKVLQFLIKTPTACVPRSFVRQIPPSLDIFGCLTGLTLLQTTRYSVRDAGQYITRERGCSSADPVFAEKLHVFGYGEFPPDLLYRLLERHDQLKPRPRSYPASLAKS